MFPSYFDHIFVHLRQKARLRPELSSKFCHLYARTRPEKPGPTYNYAKAAWQTKDALLLLLNYWKFS